MPDNDEFQPSEQPQSGTSADRRFGRYASLADGAAKDRLLGRSVSLRCVPTATADDLEQEARFLGRLQHPGLPCVYDFVRDDAGAGLVAPPPPGLSLAAAVAARADGRGIPVIASATACALTFVQVCDAMAAAHQGGVVHRALTAERILLGEHGRMVITGWEVALKSSQQLPLTSRLAASALPAADGSIDGLPDDIRAIGACLYVALAGEAPPMDAGRLAAEVAATVPEPLRRIVDKALASSAADGYASVTALRADLLLYLSGQVPTGVPGQLYRRILMPTACVLLAVAALLAAVRWNPLGAFTTWGAPLVEEDFEGDGWKSRWGMRGDWTQADGQVTSAGPSVCALILRKRLSPPVAVEYTGRFSAAVQPGELSVWWCEGDPFSLRQNEDPDRIRGWYLQAGANHNSWCGIYKAPERVRSQVRNLVLQPDRDYRFRVEITEDTLAMWIDGTKVMEHRELFPIGSGNLALYTWAPGKVFDNVRIWQQELPDLVSPLMLGDEAYRAGRHDDAIAAYRRVASSHKGRPLGEQAMYAMGLVMHLQGERDLARNAWHGLPDGPLRQRADCLAIDDFVADSDLGSAMERFSAMWQRHPQLRGLLAQRWQVCGQTLLARRPLPTAALDDWIRLRDTTFPDDGPSQWLVARILNRLGRWEETIRRFPNDHRSVVQAMLALGRDREVLAAPQAINFERATALAGLGQLDAALRTKGIEAQLHADLLCKLGRAGEAQPFQPQLARLYGDDVADLIASGSVPRPIPFLLALGRWEEAAGAGVPGVKESGGSPEAMILLGRLDEAERAGGEVRFARLLAHLAAGRVDEARALRSDLEIPRARLWNSDWFAAVVAGPLADAAMGDDAALRQALIAGAGQVGWGGRCAAVCGAALDPAKDAAVAALPWRTEVEAWLIVSAALRAELAGDRQAALAQWRAFKALPPLKRLLRGHLPSIELETTADCRIALLSRTP